MQSFPAELGTNLDTMRHTIHHSPCHTKHGALDAQISSSLMIDSKHVPLAVEIHSPVVMDSEHVALDVEIHSSVEIDVGVRLS